MTRDRLVREGITINGLPITLKDSEGFGCYPHCDPGILSTCYKDCVIGGPGSFLITVDNPARFETAIRRKLVLEISGLPSRFLRAAEIVHSPRIDCLIGEKHLYPIDPGHPRPIIPLWSAARLTQAIAVRAFKSNVYAIFWE